MKLKLAFYSCLLFLKSFAQKPIDPESYFNSKKGDKFILHAELVQYHKKIADQFPKNIKVFETGKTSEGRPQLMLAVSSEKNISNLESIRNQNLINIGLSAGNQSSDIPAICMMSYNVHGNEAVSANAVPYVLEELLSGKHEKLLTETIILIDPCVNPDGYDRYATWYTRYQANSLELNSFSVEHNEPWPGGRFNHYLFDLNRDVAWQTQIESQNRIKFYNSWMPHVHADFHEMGPNSTYYFPPSSKPFHEDISSYQRSFQEKWGEFNKKRFDQNSWLYYTKENFDLLYPSYADTYPTYNGAAGATFEQGGSGNAGVAYLRRDGDTLTLKDRINHTIANSLSTVEASADNKTETIENFNKYFQQTSKNGYGKYKSFVLKTKGHEAKVKDLCMLLDKMDINYNSIDKSQSLKAYSYDNKKEEVTSLEKGDLLISTFQPKGILTKILFEPETVVEDSNTYDITAWSLPYAFDIPAFAVETKLTGSVFVNFSKPTLNTNEKIYAYAVPINSFESSKFLAACFKQNIKVRLHEKPFKINDKSFEAGTLIISKKGNEGLGDLFEKRVEDLAKNHFIDISPLRSGLVKEGPDLGSDYVRPLKAPKVGLLIGNGTSPTAAGDIWHFFEKQLSYPISLIEESYFNRIDKSKIDVLILANGSYNNLNTKELSEWAQKGGKLILIEDANGAFAGKEGFGLKYVEKKEDNTKPSVKSYGNRDRESISDYVPGAIYKIDLDNTHPLAYGYGKQTYIALKNILESEGLTSGYNVGTIKDKNHMSGFVGKNAKEKLKNKAVFSVEEKGNGKVIYLHESPLFRAFWNSGKLLMANAIFF